MKHQLCRNCGEEVGGLYCSNCGQNNDVERLKWATLADNFLSTFVGDGAIGEKRKNIRYGLLLTLWSIMTRPGLTVAEFLEGRRRKYFNPVTILLMISGFYALVSVFFGIVDDTPRQTNDEFRQYINILYAYSQSHPALLSLLMLPFTALAYKLIFRKRSDLRFIEYAYIGIFAAIFSVVIYFVELPFKLPILEQYSGYVTGLTTVAQCWFGVSVFRKLFNISIRRGVWYWLLKVILSWTFAILTLSVIIAIIVGIYYAVDAEGMLKGFQQVVSDADGQAIRDAAQGVGDALKQPADSLKMQ